MNAVAETLPTEMPDPIIFTESAAAKVADLIAEEGNPEAGAARDSSMALRLTRSPTKTIP